MRLVAPDLNSPRARLADWIELQALSSSRNQSALSSIRTQQRRVGDDRASAKDTDPDADDIGEPEITERLADDLEERISEELLLRSERIGPAYPFELTTSETGRSQILKVKDSWGSTSSGELVYVFCLLDSGIRDGLVVVPASGNALVQSIGNIFQICSCIAVGGYTNAEVVSFGFPRATGSAFLPALKSAWTRYGSYQILTQIPFGFDDKLKDGGVDIIAWQHFDDEQAATLIIFVQVASGLGWKNKEVSADVRTIKKWFSGTAFEHFLPAICIPFPLWFDLDEPPADESGIKIAFRDGVKTRFEYREGKFGIIFDRGRIARSCAKALQTVANGGTLKIDGLDRVNEVSGWVNTVMSQLAEVRAAA